MSRFQESTFITQSLFIEWAGVVRFPKIERRRAQICMQIPDFHEVPVILIEGLKQHVCDTFFDICFQGNITPHVIPTHSSNQVQPCDLCLFAAAKDILARKRKDPGMDTQCQDIDRLPSAVHSASKVKNIKKSFNQGGVEFAFENDILWTRMDLRGCDKVRRFPTQELESVHKDLKNLPGRLANIPDHVPSMLSFPSATIHTTEDDTPYRSVPESSAVSDNQWTWAMRETLADEFPDGTDDLIG
jgi:hypothetical protein